MITSSTKLIYMSMSVIGPLEKKGGGGAQMTILDVTVASVCVCGCVQTHCTNKQIP